MKLYRKLIVRGKLTILTGLHIGDSKESVDIGGVDSPVVRRKDNNQPYIPGSSIKGKMRSLLDVAHGQSDTTRQPEHPIGAFFGALPARDANNGVPSRLIVRDAYMSEESVAFFRDSEFTDMPFTEVKFENTIDRIRGVAQHPRQFERIPAGSKFDVEFVINVFGESVEDASSQEQEFMKLFWMGIRLLEDDYLGGSGSRGYGQVKFSLEDPIQKPVENYLDANA
jgi:CRISPR-associated protein Csm3